MRLRHALHSGLALATLAGTSGCYYYTRPPPPEEPPPGYVEPQQPPPPGAEAPEQPQLPQQAPPEGTHRVHRGPMADAAPHITAPIAFGNGDGGAFRGLVFLVPDDVERVPDFGQLRPFATLFTDRFDVKPQEFRGGFPGVSKEDEWFAIRYEGPFFAPEGGTWRFRLVSDDGAVLYIDGQKVVDNDGVHGVRTAVGAADLSPGRHRIRLDYFQGNRGPVALQLFGAAPSAPQQEFIIQGGRR